MNQKQLEKYKSEMLDEIGSEYCIYGKSNAVREICTIIRKIAKVDSTALILGESGTGKEMVANAIHMNSKRTKGPFIKVNCAALNDNLLESELFGHAKGSFTGALADKIGKFEAANGGTIFLDEIGDISQQMQSRLLRVLQEKQFERVGEVRTRKCDARVIAATNRDLMLMVREGRFRLDLYYRLNVVSIYLPSLSERREDIPNLVNYFISKFNERENAEIMGVSAEAMERLVRYGWPGNVRELENVVEQACVMATSGVIEDITLPGDGDELAKGTQFITFREPLERSANAGSGGGSCFTGRRIVRGAEVTRFDSGSAAAEGETATGPGTASRTESDTGDSAGSRGDAASTVTIGIPCELERAEELLIRKTLEFADNNKTRAAKLLGISLRGLQMKLKKMGG